MRAEESVALVVLLPRHAIGAAEVAAVHHRYPQIPHGAAQCVPGTLERAEGNEDFGLRHGGTDGVCNDAGTIRGHG